MSRDAQASLLSVVSAQLSAVCSGLKLADTAPLGLAVSGGSDSLALLHLVSLWAKRNGRGLHIVTVDHGLRPEAEQETDYVRQIGTALGHTHAVLRWATPHTGQKAARDARLRLICEHLQTRGIGVLLMGHTRTDVLETALIRRRRGVRGWALAGPAPIAPAPVWPQGRNLAVVRPLVSVLRADLQAYLRQQAIVWCDDPSNQNPDYERARIRMALQHHPKMVARCLTYIEGLQQARAEADLDLAQKLDTDLSVGETGLIWLRQDRPDPRLLTCAVRYAGGHDRLPRAEAVARWQANTLKQGARRTLGGAWFQRAAQGYWVGRAPARTSHPPSGDEKDRQADTLWDGRYLSDPSQSAPLARTLPFLMRAKAPPGPYWREIISERAAFEALCYRLSGTAGLTR